MKLKDKKFKTIKVRGGKEYVEVRERLEYLSKEFDGEYSINSEYEYFESRKMWVVKSTLTLKQGEVISTYTGLAQEVEGGTGVNSTSALENAETSAVGRACAMAGIGVDIAIASADEVHKAQNRTAETPKEQAQPVAEAAAHDAEQPKYATARQKEEIIRLLNNPVIQRQEKTKMLLNINKLDEERAKASIDKLKKVIEEREKEQSEAA